MKSKLLLASAILGASLILGAAIANQGSPTIEAENTRLNFGGGTSTSDDYDLSDQIDGGTNLTSTASSTSYSLETNIPQSEDGNTSILHWKELEN